MAEFQSVAVERSEGLFGMSGKLLLVEDDPEAGAYVAKGLREAGYVVEHVKDGRDALYLATSANFDAVVLDRNLPGMDGLSVLKAIRAAGVLTPVLILSALGHIDERVKGLRAGSPFEKSLKWVAIVAQSACVPSVIAVKRARVCGASWPSAIGFLLRVQHRPLCGCLSAGIKAR